MTQTIQDYINKPQQMSGLDLLESLDADIIKACFFDPQYRGILDKQKYGNEGKNREKARCALSQMTEEMIIDFIHHISRVLTPSGHLFLWIDKFHLCEGVKYWFDNTALEIVDLITWEKPRIGMGYRTRRKCEYLMVLQKLPKRAKDVWTIRNIPDVMLDKVDTKQHPHAKPIMLQKRLIEAVTIPGDYICDPAMGSGSVFMACQSLKDRHFIGCDLAIPDTQFNDITLLSQL